MMSLDDIPQRFILVDFQNTLWKSWMVKPFGGEEMTRSDGYPSGHVFRMFRTLYKWKRDFGGDLVLAYEGLEQHRYDLFPGYKANRRRSTELLPADPTLTIEVDNEPESVEIVFDPGPDVRRMMSYFKCLEIKAPEAEADDAIAAWVHLHPDANHLILSSDKDLWTLRGPRVSIVSFQDMLSDEHIKKTCTKQFGTPTVKSMTLAKALFGDKSDGIPSVPRLLKKHVAAQLAQVSTPDELFDKLHLLPDSTAAKLRMHESQVRTMYEVVMLRREVKIKKRERAGDLEGLQEFLQSFDCHTLLPYAETMAL